MVFPKSVCSPMILFGWNTENALGFWRWLWRCLRYRKAIPISDIKEVITRTCIYLHPIDFRVPLLSLVVEDCPKGYPKLAAFLSSEHNFSLYRGFSYLHSRVLLDLQDEISTLEKELDTADTFDSENGHENRLSSRRRDQVYAQNIAADRSRRHILSDIRAKLVDYGMFRLVLTHNLSLTLEKMKFYAKHAN